MNLSAIVNVVGQRITMVQPRDVTAMMTFATMRHDQLYRSFLWRDSLIMLSLAIDTNSANYNPQNNYMPTKGNLILPSIFQQAIAVRTSENKLNVERPMVYYRVDFDNFKATGLATDFFILPSAVWEFDTPQDTGMLVANAADYGQNVTMDIQGNDGVSISRNIVTLNANQTAGPNTDLIYGFQKPATQGTVQLAFGDPPALNGLLGVKLQPTDTDAPKCQRLRIMSIPSNNTTLRVLGKRTPPPFAANSDVPGVNGLDAILVALVYYDMLHRDERGGTPESDKAMIEAVGPKFLIDGTPGGFLGKLIEEEVVQAAHNTRIFPEYGFGDDESVIFPSKGNFVSNP